MSLPVFPRFFRVRQRLDPLTTLNIAVETARLLRPAFEQATLPSNARVAIAVGSRGIDRLAEIVRAVVEEIRRIGAKPVIVPAMGSHAGATAEGQLQLLADYGITEPALGAPILSSMETERVGTTAAGLPIHISREALSSDAVLLVNRVKPHTDFAGRLGSGLMKMLVVGLGKREGAAAFHAAASRQGYEPVLLALAPLCQQHLPLIGGLAILENARHACARLHFLAPGEFLDREPALVAEAARLMPRLPFEDIDLLVVDAIGKNISGTGMDPNILGRHVNGYLSSLAGDGPIPRIRRIFVRGLTPETRGNAVGIGMADFTTSRLVRAMDAQATYTNALTALSVQAAKIPIHFDTDREVLAAALDSLALTDPTRARVVRIANTLALETFEASEAFDATLRTRPDLERLTEPQPLAFDPDGNLAALQTARPFPPGPNPAAAC